MPHSEIFLLRAHPFVWHLIAPNLMHFVLHVILDLLVTPLLLHVGLVLVMSLDLPSLLDAEQSADLSLIALGENRSDLFLAPLLVLLGFKLFYLVVILDT